MEETKIDKLRNELIALRKERESIIFEKGLAAEDNKDLRENSTYDYWFEKEILANARITLLIKMIGDLSKKDNPKKIVKKRKIEKVRGTFEPHKWL
jgi:transcription elongation GreA/GreB family factor